MCRLVDAGTVAYPPHAVKFFADGTVEDGSALLLEPYCDDPRNHGVETWTRDNLRAAVAAADAEQFQVHLHAIGDAAVRNALDAIQYAKCVNPCWRRRPVISHLQLVRGRDLPRFRELEVIANFEPYRAQYDKYQSQFSTTRLGLDRASSQYLMGSMLRTGAHLSFGTDWPVTTLNSMEGIAVAVNRSVGGGEPFLAAERLTVAQALRTYTAARRSSRAPRTAAAPSPPACPPTRSASRKTRSRSNPRIWPPSASKVPGSPATAVPCR